MAEPSGITPKLIEDLNRGEVKAFDKVYHTYYLYLCSIAVYYVHDPQTAMEIVNDVFVSFWQSRRLITYPPLPYLRRSIQNASVSHLRSSYFHEKMMTRQMEEIYEYLENRILSSDDPLSALENSELSKIIQKSVEKLPDRCRTIFKRCVYDGKTYSEVADELNIHVSTVRVQMKIALDKLHKLLGSPCMMIILTNLLYSQI